MVLNMVQFDFQKIYVLIDFGVSQRWVHSKNILPQSSGEFGPEDDPELKTPPDLIQNFDLAEF